MQRLRKSHILWALVMLALLFPHPAASQGGNGVIREGDVYGSANVPSLNPLRCDNIACQRIAGLLFPHLIGIDPAAGQFAPTGDPEAVASGWDIAPDGSAYTLHLRSDLSWSDGTPVTAYDVLYSYLAIASAKLGSPDTDRVNSLVRGAVPLDDHTIRFFTGAATCSTLDHLNFPIIPAHVFTPDFAQQAAAVFSAPGDPLTLFTQWRDALPQDYFAPVNDSPFDSHPGVTAGVFEFGTLQPTDFIRLMRDGTEAFSYVDVPDWDTAVARFMSGDLNFIDNPPYERWDDLRAAPDVRVFEYPGLEWNALSFNLADPHNPQNALDKNGSRLDQGRHPVFGDVRVRRAVQMAIDVNALIAAAVDGHGTALAASQVPASLGFDPALAPQSYDPEQAKRLLEEAGWKDINRDGIRECYGCLYAQPGEQLLIGLDYSSSQVPRQEVIARVIHNQLTQVGFYVTLNDTDTSSPSSEVYAQRYDAALVTYVERYPVDPDQTGLFTTAGDVIGQGQNTGSYYNPDVERLMAQARALPGCDAAGRAALYRQIEAILQADQPDVWLFAPNGMFAARGGVLGFDPYPNAPFWNIRQWIVVH